MSNVLPAPSLLLCEACGMHRSAAHTETLRVPYPVVEGAHRVIVVCDDSPICRQTMLTTAEDQFPDGVPANVVPFDVAAARRL